MEEKLEKKKELLTECATELEKLPEDVVGDILLVIKGAALVCQSNKKASWQLNIKKKSLFDHIGTFWDFLIIIINLIFNVS